MWERIGLHGGANALCKDAQVKPEDKTENSRSVGFLLTYGKFKFLDLGDLTWDREMMLACPANKVGAVTLFQATHHGFVNGQSGAPAPSASVPLPMSYSVHCMPPASPKATVAFNPSTSS